MRIQILDQDGKFIVASGSNSSRPSGVSIRNDLI
jgi:hypothetical protein